jgi:signal transduction histidine kinase
MTKKEPFKTYPDDLFGPDDPADQDGGMMFDNKAATAGKENQTEKDVIPWKVLIVDDEEDIHSVTQLALRNFTYQGRGIEFFNAYSAAEAKTIIEEHPDIALILLDVVMETNQAGLDLARYIRESVGNRHTRIILRTGQPGHAPEREVILSYEIDDYKTKTELTSFKLFTVALASLRAYQTIKDIEKINLSLHEEIQERIKVEKNLVMARKKAEKADRIKTQFLSQLSREIKTPLDTILDSTSEIRNEINDKINEDIKDQFDRMTFTGKRIVRTVQLILDLSEVRTREYEPTPIRVDFRELCELIIEEYSLNHLKKDIEISLNVETDQTESVTDEYAARQVLYNLIDNAVKFTSKGKVSVNLARNGDDRMVAVISDTGKGIDNDFRKRMFDPFAQEDKERSEGIGLGLALVKAYADRNKYRINAESSPGKGTSVSVEF